MKRQQPFLSLFGFVSTTILLAILGLMLWRSGGMAFSPGELSAMSRPGVSLRGFASHADFAPRCELCHQPLETTQDVLCLDCHNAVGEQIQAQNGTHGHIEQVRRCAACHSDHQGVDFNPTEGAFSFFDHSLTHFALVWHQVDFEAAPMECVDCHDSDGQFTVSTEDCIVCHATKDVAFTIQHRQDFGEDCTACHDGQDRMVKFDHNTTSFALEGQHTQTSCAGCHALDKLPGARGGGGLLAEDIFISAPDRCADCHGEPESHKGMFSSNCSECHNPASWSPANLEGKPFEHAAQTGFTLLRHQLDFDKQALVCNDCHRGALQDEFDVQTCVECHSQGEEAANFMSQHQEEYGLGCIGCHDGEDRMHGFEHARVFPLEGRHAEAECVACHAEQRFSGTPKECVQCHEEPGIHAGFFGVQCQNCHMADGWAPARLRLHSFPLTHGEQGEQDCKVCHNERYVAYTCYGCHEHQPDAISESHTRAGIAMEELPNCTKCHPTGLIDDVQP